MTTTPPALPYLPHRAGHVAYADVGNGSPVLFIAGTGMHGNGWLPQVNAVVHLHRCIWFDHRGTGSSRDPVNEVSVASMADDALTVLNAAAVSEPVHVVGHSLGGLVALHFAMTHPRRVRSLALLCTAARGKGLTSLPWASWMLAARMGMGTFRSRRNAFLKLVVPDALLTKPDLTAMQLAPYFGHDLVHLPKVASKQLSALSAYDATPNLQDLPVVPTLILSAELDRIARPALSEPLRAGLPHATSVVVEDHGHAVPVYAPHVVSAPLMELLSGA